MQCGHATGVFRMLICTMAVVVLSGGPAVIASPATLPARASTTDLLTRAAHLRTSAPEARDVRGNELVPAAGSEDNGHQPRRQFGWPLAGSPTVVRGFHAPASRYGPGHRGVDLTAQAGEPVLAAGAGTVMFAGTVAGRGVVSVNHPGGRRTTYEPVSATVAVGQQVSRGERIGTVTPGHPGCPVIVCLHWGVLRGADQDKDDPAGPLREYLDPLRLIIGTRVRLLPIDDPPAHR
jgi:murein DD-endopeptidase MepM/ murein hydrolase activator NlpD